MRQCFPEPAGTPGGESEKERQRERERERESRKVDRISLCPICAHPLSPHLLGLGRRAPERARDCLGSDWNILFDGRSRCHSVIRCRKCAPAGNVQPEPQLSFSPLPPNRPKLFGSCWVDGMSKRQAYITESARPIICGGIRAEVQKMSCGLPRICAS